MDSFLQSRVSLTAMADRARPPRTSGEGVGVGVREGVLLGLRRGGSGVRGGMVKVM